MFSKKIYILWIVFFISFCYHKPYFNTEKSIVICFESDCFKSLLENIINNSKISIDIALYEFYNEKIARLLVEAYKRGVKIRAVSDYDCELNSGWKFLSSFFPVFFGNSNGIMHNKYIIVDNRFVLTGSLNLTSDLGKNYNSVILIDSENIANLYKQDFEKMFLNRKFSSSKDDIGCVVGMGIKEKVGENFISTFFTPYAKCYEYLNGGKIFIDNPYTSSYDPEDYTNAIGYKLLPLLNSATYSIKILAFSLTDKIIFHTLKLKRLEGLKIDIYLDYYQLKANYDYIHNYLYELLDAGANIKITFNQGRRLHHKIIIIDRNIFLVGSMNFSNNGVRDNDENFVIIEGGKNIYNLFEKEIAKIDVFSYDFKYFK